MSTLWVGCLTDQAPGLVRFTVDETALTRTAEHDLPGTGWLVGTDWGMWAIQHLEESRVVPVRVDGADAALGEPTPTHGDAACHAALNPSRTALAVAEYTSGSVAVLAVDGDRAYPAVSLSFTGASGVDPERQEAPHAHQAVWLDDEHFLVCDLGADLIRVLRWADGELSELAPIPTTPGFGPRHLVLRRGEHLDLAVAGELSGAVASLRNGGRPDVWTPVSEVPGTLIGGSAPSALRALSDERLVLANRMIDTIAILEWTLDGDLALLDEFDCGGVHTRDLVVHENRLWVANQHSGDICCFAPADGGWRLASRTEVTAPATLLF